MPGFTVLRHLQEFVAPVVGPETTELTPPPAEKYADLKTESSSSVQFR